MIRTGRVLPRFVVTILTAVAFVLLHDHGLVGSLPLWALLSVLLLAAAVAEVSYQFASARGGYGGLISVPLVAVTLVIYATGWGSALAIGYVFPLGEAYKLERPPSLRVSVATIALGLGAGEVAIGGGLVKSRIALGDAHALAALSALGLVFVVRVLAGTNAKRRSATSALIEREASFRQLFEQNPHPMWVYDEHSLAFLAVNEAAVRTYGFSHEQWLSMDITDIRPEEDVAALKSNVVVQREAYEESGVWRHRKADGTTVEVEITSHRTEYLGSSGVLVMSIDVTERNRLERHLAYQAVHDDLTGLANRRQLTRRIAETVLACRASGDALVLVSIDIDDFHQINAALGHGVGDFLLKRVAEDLTTLAPGALVARVGSDEFSLLFTSRPDEAESKARSLAESVPSHLSTPLELHGAAVAVESSVGAVIGPSSDEETPMLAFVQLALSQAKKSVSRIVVTDVRSGRSHLPSIAVIGELRHAIDRGDLRLHYQPKIALGTEKVVGFEALVRWQHPDRGLLFPDAFVPLAERTGLVRPLAAYVLEEAAHQLAYWRNMGIDLTLSVNLAAANLTDPDLPKMIFTALSDHGCPPDRIVAEITEGTVMAETERVTAVVKELAAAGLEFSIDDFGTAHSSLARLRALPLSEIKLDKSFVNSIDTSRTDAAIVRSSINLAHDLGLRVVAEGVESAEIAGILNQWGCELAQGYLFGKPMSAIEATRRLSPEQRAVPAALARRSSVS